MTEVKNISVEVVSVLRGLVPLVKSEAISEEELCDDRRMHDRFDFLVARVWCRMRHTSRRACPRSHILQGLRAGHVRGVSEASWTCLHDEMKLCRTKKWSH